MELLELNKYKYKYAKISTSFLGSPLSLRRQRQRDPGNEVARNICF